MRAARLPVLLLLCTTSAPWSCSSPASFPAKYRPRFAPRTRDAMCGADTAATRLAFLQAPGLSPATSSKSYCITSRPVVKLGSSSLDQSSGQGRPVFLNTFLPRVDRLSINPYSSISLHAKADTSGDSSSSEGDGYRINKCFKEFASRREADRFIQDGRVCINGEVAVFGARVFPGDTVTLDGDLIRWEGLNVIDQKEQKLEPFVYIKYWKPRGVVCTTDLSIRGNIIERINHPERIFPVGRLDKDSSGLILLTSDGRVPNAVLRSGQRHDKRYLVRANREVDARDVEELAAGVVITTVAQRDRTTKSLTAPTLPCRVRQTGSRTLEIILQEGRNRQIRKMMEALGYDVVELHREEVMGIDLSGLRMGEWKDLNKREMDTIRKAIEAPAAAWQGRASR